MYKARLRRGWAGILAALGLPALALVGAAAAADAMATPRLKPPPPGPAFLSVSDLQHLKDVREAVERRQWSKARDLAVDVTDPIARGLAGWLYYYAEDPGVGLAEADAFLDSHPGWPAAAKIQAHVEKRIPDAASREEILNFFATRDPVTGEGEILLARAQFEAGAAEAGAIHLRNAWIKRDFTLGDEQRLLARHGGRLTPEDHAARVDRLLWDREVTAAQRVFSRLNSSDNRMAEMRASLILSASKADDQFNALPPEERLDSGVLLAAVRYYRRKEDEPLAIALALQAPSEPSALRNPVAWWSERQLLMRWALKERQYADAYAMAAGHGLDFGNEFAEAEFSAGWIALRFLNAPERAEAHFRALASAVGAPISVARAYYWLARTAEARGRDAEARERYARAAQFIYTYYGQLAAEKIGAPLVGQTFAPPVTPTPEERARFSSRPVAAALRMLSDLEADREFLVFSYQLDDELDSPGEYVELARLAERRGATHAAVRAGKVAVGRNAFAAEVAYPLVFVPEEAARFAPPEIILGLSRQESEFNSRAYSSAGARGLMQLIPSTAQITARKEGLRYNRSALLDDPVYNMIIGSAHLSHLFERYRGSRVMTLAAYNAGASRVEEWVRRYGDPRAPDVDPIDWVEQIPFAETRNYVQRVLENTQIYRGRLTQAPIAGRLVADLELGGPQRRAGMLPNAIYAIALPPLPERTEKLASAPPPAAAEPAPRDEGDPVANASTGVNSNGAAPAGAESSLSEDDLSDADATDFLGDVRARPLPKATPQESVKARSKRVTRPTPIANANDTPLADTAIAPDPIPAGPPTAPSEDVAPSAILMTSQPVEAPPLSSQPDCGTYRDFIAETAKEEARAADLNAGMLAELRGGGVNCEATDETEATPTPTPTPPSN